MTTAQSGVTGSMTARQLAELRDDGWRHELIDGALRTKAPAGEQRGHVAVNVTYLVVDHARRHELGRCHLAGTGFVLRRDPDTVRAPDLAFTRSERLPDQPRPGLLRFVWVIDPEAEVVTVHRDGNVIGLVQGSDAVLSGEDVLPGFAARLGDIFA